MKITKEELIDLIKKEAKSLKENMIKESKAIEKSTDVYNVNMNSNDELGDSKKALTYKDSSKKVEKEGETEKEVKMNSNDSKLGSDEKASVATKVEAGTKKGGSSVTAGQAKANFTSKKDIQGTKQSIPFDDRVGELEINSEDKLVDEKTKTYVTAGEAKGGNTHTSGQAKAEVHEKAIEKDMEEKAERIAVGIEIDGSNIEGLKESYTKKELKNFILSEAKKVAEKHKKDIVIAKKRNKLMEELSLIKEGLEECGETMEEIDGMDESLASMLKLREPKEEDGTEEIEEGLASMLKLREPKEEGETEEKEEEIEEGIWPFGKKEKITPEQALEKGLEVLKSNRAKAGVYKILKTPEQKEKFKMFLGYNPNIKYQSWDNNAEAPDGTKGYFVDSTTYSGQGSGGSSSPAA